MSTTPPPPSGWREQQPDWQQAQPAEQAPPAYPPPSQPPGYGYQAQTQGAGVGEPAQWWRRALAIIIDILILAVVSGIINAVLGLSTFERSTDPITGEVTIDFAAVGASSLVSLALGLLYSGVLEGSARGQSVGKMALAIQVRDANTGGSIGFGRAVLRRLVYNLLFYALVIPGIINVLSPLWDARKQAWHDKAVSSLVVNAS